MAHHIINATLKNKTVDGVLVEDCEPDCNDDTTIYKGIFMSRLRYVIDETESEDLKKHYFQFIDNSTESINAVASCYPPSYDINNTCNIQSKDGGSRNNRTGPVYGWEWEKPFAEFSASVLATPMS